MENYNVCVQEREENRFKLVLTNHVSTKSKPQNFMKKNFKPHKSYKFHDMKQTV